MSYTFLKRNVFDLDLKRLTSEKARISKGSLFHSRGAATENLVLQGVNDPLMTVIIAPVMRYEMRLVHDTSYHRKLLYLTFVRSYTGYASEVWAPSTIGSITKK